MPSSTSSSDARLPASRWGFVLGSALLASLAFAGVIELRLALRGFDASVVDSDAAWIEQRQRASELGPRALVVVGASRPLLSLDLDVLRARTGLEPVQLAIDGTNFLPIFKGLSEDESVRGTIIVDVQDHTLIQLNPDDAAARWQRAYERRSVGALPDFERMEGWLTRRWRNSLRSYANGARPVDALVHYLLPAKPEKPYLVTLEDRSILADYTSVRMPDHYYRRVARTLGISITELGGMTYGGVERTLRARVATVHPDNGDRDAYGAQARELGRETAAILARGGRVYFVKFPQAGLMDEIDRRRYPRAEFWDRLAATVGAPTLHADEVSEWAQWCCPDGSHIDYRDRAAFTGVLVEHLGIQRASGH